MHEPHSPTPESTGIRHYRAGDHGEIATIFCRAIHEIACADYTEEQRLVWSSRRPNPEYWRDRCELKRPFVAVTGTQISGFLELDPDGHIDCAYVNPDFQRRGVMTLLVGHAIDTATRMRLPSLYVEASITARPLFEKMGFQWIADNLVEIGGVTLRNFRMERWIQPSAE